MTRNRYTAIVLIAALSVASITIGAESQPPAKSYVITDFGAIGDGQTMNT